jgi:hypothetical protein
MKIKYHLFLITTNVMRERERKGNDIEHAKK